MPRTRTSWVAAALLNGLALVFWAAPAPAQDRRHYVVLGVFEERWQALDFIGDGCLPDAGYRVRVVDGGAFEGGTSGTWVVVTGPVRGLERAEDIRDRLTEFAKQTGDEKHQPAPLLKRLADAGKGFGSLAKDS